MGKVFKLIKSIFLFFKLKILFRSKVNISLINSIEGKININLQKKSKLQVGKFLMVRGPLYLRVCETACVKIGNNNFFNHNCSLTSMNNIVIGNNCMFGNNLVIVDHNHISSNCHTNEYQTESIEIGNNVWVGANCSILKGVKIGDGAVIAANSVVNKNVPENEMWGGCPAKKISERK